jgi:hypothetical protein
MFCETDHQSTSRNLTWGYDAARTLVCAALCLQQKCVCCVVAAIMWASVNAYVLAAGATVDSQLHSQISRYQLVVVLVRGGCEQLTPLAMQHRRV